MARSCTLLAAAMTPHYRAAIDMVHRLQMRYTAGLYASTKAAIAQATSKAATVHSSVHSVRPFIRPATSEQEQRIE